MNVHVSIRCIGRWVCGLVGLAALILGYWAVTSAAATVTIEWSTASELNTAGFNLYRSTSQQGPFTRINDHLIPASPDPLVGGSYIFTDTGVTAGQVYYYQLEDVEIGGATTRHGPVQVRAERSFSPATFLAAALLVSAAAGWAALSAPKRRTRAFISDDEHV